MRRVRFVAEARQEFLAEVVYYREAGPGLGQRFAAAVKEATTRASAFPHVDSPSASGTRRVFTKGFPFYIVYRPERDGIVVFAVAPHARRPGYWRSRMKTGERSMS